MYLARPGEQHLSKCGFHGNLMEELEGDKFVNFIQAGPKTVPISHRVAKSARKSTVEARFSTWKLSTQGH